MRENESEILEGLLAASPNAPQLFERLCSKTADWKITLDRAFCNGTGGVLEHLLKSSRYELPHDVSEYLHKRRTAEKLWQSHLQKALDEVLSHLKGESIPSAVLKGIPLSERLYSDPFVRLSSDLDLLIRRSDLDRATSLMKKIGYDAQSSPTDRYEREHHHHVCLFRPNSPTIELHFLAYRGLGISIPSEALISRAEEYRTSTGARTLTLSAEDEILYLCVHAAGHAFVQLSWLYDIKMFIYKNPDIDWGVVIDRAASFKAATALFFSLKTVRRRLGAVLPDQIEDRFPKGLRSRAASFLIDKVAMRSMPRSIATLGNLLLSYVLCEGSMSGMRLLRHHFSRIIRRRIQHLFPRIAPHEWSA